MIKKLALLVATLCGSALTAADLSISYVFTDHMVLQREKPVAVWGWANAGETVTVEFADQKNTTVAGPDGKWLLYLSPMPASFESRVIKISGSNSAADASKPRSIEIKDVLVGEVWLGSGQSNMELGVDYCLNAKEEVANANYPNIRFFFEHSKHQNDPQANGKGNWIACSPKTVGYFSGTLYFMGRQLHKELNVPIGLINSSQGGTKIESWMSLEAQHSDDFLKQHYEALVQYGKEVTSEESRKKFLEELKAWYVADEKANLSFLTPFAEYSGIKVKPMLGVNAHGSTQNNFRLSFMIGANAGAKNCLLRGFSCLVLKPIWAKAGNTCASRCSKL
ncbi:MAG: hypothetical protein EBS00_05425 [Verrucomicrobia bacterium]|nr:hypothetical protein [Verrucomicrobiota bacterium]